MKCISQAGWLSVRKFTTDYINRAIEKGKMSSNYIEVKPVDDKNELIHNPA